MLFFSAYGPSFHRCENCSPLNGEHLKGVAKQIGEPEVTGTQYPAEIHMLSCVRP